MRDVKFIVYIASLRYVSMIYSILYNQWTKFVCIIIAKPIWVVCSLTTFVQLCMYLYEFNIVMLKIIKNTVSVLKVMNLSRFKPK